MKLPPVFLFTLKFLYLAFKAAKKFKFPILGSSPTFPSLSERQTPFKIEISWAVFSNENICVVLKQEPSTAS